MKFLLFLFSIQGSCFILNACTTGEVRLVNGTTPNQGRVEICINGVWGTVCDDLWTNNNARVVCRQLGYSTDGAIYFSGPNGYGSGNGSIFLDDVVCPGNEYNLLNCTHNPIESHNCFHSEDVGVLCPSLDTCTLYNSIPSPTAPTIIMSSTNSFFEPPSSSPCNCPSFPSPFKSSYQISSITTTPLASIVFTVTTTLTLSVTVTTTEGGTIASAVDSCTASVMSAIILPVLLLIIIALLLISLSLIYYYKIRKSDNKNESKLERKGTLMEVSNASVYGNLQPPDGNDGMVYSPMYNSASIANSVEPVPLDAIGSNRYQTSNNRPTDIPQYEMATAAYEYVDNEPAYDRPNNNNKNRSVSAPYETIPGEEDEVTYEAPDAGALRT